MTIVLCILSAMAGALIMAILLLAWGLSVGRKLEDKVSDAKVKAAKEAERRGKFDA